MHSTVSLSIALVTRNRPESLERTLVSLRAQEPHPFEVVISDDSGSERAEATKKIANRFECVYSRGPQRGLYANRNAAFLRCRGTHVRTMDDDHILPPGHLSACVSAVQSDPTAIWTTGEHGFVAGHPVAPAATASRARVRVRNNFRRWMATPGRNFVGWRRRNLEYCVTGRSLLTSQQRRLRRHLGKSLFCGNNNIGDLLVVTPLFEALKRTFPNAEIIAGIASRNTQVLLGNPYVDRGVTICAKFGDRFFGRAKLFVWSNCRRTVERVGS